MSQQPALQPQEFPVQCQQQQSERYRGSGGGGGGGHRPDGDYSPEEVTHIFEQLAKASAQFFSSAEFVITEQSAQHLLTNTFTTLAQATRNGDLRAGLPKLVDGSAATRSEALHNVTTRSITKGTPPVFDESDSAGVLEQLRNCCYPMSPNNSDNAESDSSRPRPAVQGTGLTACYSTSELCGNLSRKYSEQMSAPGRQYYSSRDGLIRNANR